MRFEEKHEPVGPQGWWVFCCPVSSDKILRNSALTWVESRGNFHLFKAFPMRATVTPSVCHPADGFSALASLSAICQCRLTSTNQGRRYKLTASLLFLSTRSACSSIIPAFRKAMIAAVVCGKVVWVSPPAVVSTGGKGFEPCREILGGQRSAEVIALQDVTVELFQV